MQSSSPPWKASSRPCSCRWEHRRRPGDSACDCRRPWCWPTPSRDPWPRARAERWRHPGRAERFGGTSTDSSLLLVLSSAHAEGVALGYFDHQGGEAKVILGERCHNAINGGLVVVFKSS